MLDSSAQIGAADKKPLGFFAVPNRAVLCGSTLCSGVSIFRKYSWIKFNFISIHSGVGFRYLHINCHGKDLLSSSSNLELLRRFGCFCIFHFRFDIRVFSRNLNRQALSWTSIHFQTLFMLSSWQISWKLLVVKELLTI